jgi:hypothetical protein
MFKTTGHVYARNDWYFAVRVRRWNGTYRNLILVDFQTRPKFGDRCLYVSVLGRGKAFWTPAVLA